MKKLIGQSVLVMMLVMFNTSCEDEDHSNPHHYQPSDHGRQVTIEVTANTSWGVDVLIEGFLEGRLEPGQKAFYYRNMVEGEPVDLKFLVHNSTGSYEYDLSLNGQDSSCRVSVNDYGVQFY